MARLTDVITQQRDQQVLGRARPHLDPGEDVVEWARARHPTKRRNGYAFLTRRKLLVVWLGHTDGHGVVPWASMRSWGVDHEHDGGPLLGAESEGARCLVHLPVSGHRAAARVTSFLRRFAHLAPSECRPLRREGHPRRFFTEAPTVAAPRRSAGAHTKRVVLTILGLLLVAGGLAITPIPGPWSFPIVLAGLAVLASEYDWAQDVLEWVREKSRETAGKLKARRAAR